MDGADGTDVLSEVLRSLRVAGTVYFCDSLVAPWTKRFADPDRASFHQVRGGVARLRVGEREVVLGPGDLAFLGPGVEHTLEAGEADATSSAAGGGRGDAGGDGGGDRGTLLLCGYCAFELGGTGPAASLFPELAVLGRERLSERAWLAGVLDRLGEEYLSPAPGAVLAVERLTEVLVVELVRLDFGRDGRGGLVRALADPKVAAALAALHAEPERPWTLESLARRTGLSRAGFAARFAERVGQPMFAYLTDLRVRRARTLLAESTLSLAEIAERVGYGSDAAFAKTFRRCTGTTPAAWRKASRGRGGDGA